LRTGTSNFGTGGQPVVTRARVALFLDRCAVLVLNTIVETGITALNKQTLAMVENT